MNYELTFNDQSYNAFSELIAKDYERVLSIAKNFLKDENLAQRATRHAFTEVFLYRKPFLTDEALQEYLRKSFCDCVIRFLKDYPDKIIAAYKKLIL